MKKNIGKLFLTVLCAAAVITTGLAFRSEAEPNRTAPEFVLAYGTVSGVENGRISINRQDSNFDGQELIINISDETRVLDAVNGFPADPAQLKSGETIYAYLSPAMTLSLPPISNGKMILVNIPADYKVPEYITVEKLTVNSNGTTGSITATNDTTYTITAESQILPYLTRNIVTIQDLVKGKTCLVWSSDDNTASRIIAFADKVSNDDGVKGPGSNDKANALDFGWSEEYDRWYFYDESGNTHKGWLSDNGSWYYLDLQSGVMQTGFITIEGKTYYLLEDGKMLTNAKTFTPDENGVLH